MIHNVSMQLCIHVLLAVLPLDKNSSTLYNLDLNMEKIKWPKVSFILLTLNGGDGVRKCLESINEQSYPQHLIDIVSVDNGSIDDSVKIAKNLGAKVLIYPNGTLYSNWIKGLHTIKGEYIFFVDQDIVLRGRNFIKKMISPLLVDKRLMGTYTKEYSHPKMHWVTRFLSYNVCQCDPLYEFLTPPIEKSFIEDHKKYIVSKFDIGKMPPICRVFWRIEYLKKTPNWKVDNYFDHDFMIQSVKAGYPYFAYVHSAGYFHFHANNLKHLLKKRVRNLYIHFFPYRDETEYKWLNTDNKKEVIRIFFWVFYANLFFPEAIRGFFRYAKNRDWVLLMQPVVSITITDALLWNFLRNKVGRRIILESFKTLFNVKY